MRMLKGKDERMQSVRFRHPDSGEEARGHVANQGHQGVTVVGPEGNQHKVPHGQYMHHDDGPSVNKKALLEKAAKHLDLGPQAMLAIHAVGVILAAGGVDHVSKLTTKDVKVTKDAVLILPHKLRLDATKHPRLAALVSHLASQPEGPLLRVKGKPVDHDSLVLYARKMGGQQEQELAKASPLAIGLAHPSPAAIERSRWMHQGYACEWRKGPTGIHFLTIRHPDMGLPLHEVVGNLRKAQTLARDFIAHLVKGKIPPKGVFAPDD